MENKRYRIVENTMADGAKRFSIESKPRGFDGLISFWLVEYAMDTFEDAKEKYDRLQKETVVKNEICGRLDKFRFLVTFSLFHTFRQLKKILLKSIFL